MTQTNKTIAIFPGRFDPITNGHIDIIKRAANTQLFDTIIIAVSDSGGTAYFNQSDRVSLAQRALASLELLHTFTTISVKPFSGLLVNFALSQQAHVIIRGIRSMSDLSREHQMAQINRSMQPMIDTFFLMTSPQYTFISASLVREIATLGGDVSAFVPAAVNEALTH